MSTTNGHKAKHPNLTGPGFQPGPDPRRGVGKKGRSGRLPNAIRQKYRDVLWRNVPWLRDLAWGVSHEPLLDSDGQPVLDGEGKPRMKPVSMADRQWAHEQLERYGLGTTVTQTDTDGDDAPPPATAPGRLNPDQIRAEVARILAEPSRN